MYDAWVHSGVCKEVGRIQPAWTVSNVTPTSVYVHTLELTFSSSGAGGLAGSYLIDGNASEVWRDLPPTPTGGVGQGELKYTHTINKKVSWGKAGELQMKQYFALEGCGSLKPSFILILRQAKLK